MDLIGLDMYVPYGLWFHFKVHYIKEINLLLYKQLVHVINCNPLIALFTFSYVMKLILVACSLFVPLHTQSLMTVFAVIANLWIKQGEIAKMVRQLLSIWRTRVQIQLSAWKTFDMLQRNHGRWVPSQSLYLNFRFYDSWFVSGRIIDARSNFNKRVILNQVRLSA